MPRHYPPDAYPCALPDDALAVVEETGLTPAEVARDVDDVRHGYLTPDALTERCLDGADDDRVDGWHAYVDAVVAHVDAARARANE
jgi:hypothetical protein